MGQPTAFWNRIARRYAKKPVSDEAAYQHKLATTQSYFSPDMRVLEVACGTGTTALYHAPYVAHIDAIDFSANMIAIAEEKATAQAVDNVSFSVCSIEAFESETGVYDGILAMSILHLVGDTQGVLARLFDLLKPGGMLFSSTVCLTDVPGILKHVFLIGSAIGIFPKVRSFTSDQLVNCLTEAGFEIDYRWAPQRPGSVFVVARKPRTVPLDSEA